MISELEFENDALDRGEYAMTLFKIINDYAPKEPKHGFEVVRKIEMGPINHGELILPDTPEKDVRDMHALEHGEVSPNIRNDIKRTPTGLLYSSKLHHLDNEAFIIAISGSWGTGKTEFAKIFRNLLTDKEIKHCSEDYAKIIKENRYNNEGEDEVIYFNAWQNDFFDDPLIPFSRMLIERVCKNHQTEYQEADKQFTSYLRMLRNAKNDEPEDNNDNLPLDKRIEKLNDALQACISEKNQKKVVVQVDELDRCKPTFAIQLLEIVKHLFNVKGLVFMFFLDIKELRHCVKTVYGNEFDAVGYLERFFDYTSMLPKGNEEKLFNKFADEYELPKDRAEYYDLCRLFKLTPREIKGLCSSFYYLNKYHLTDYPSKARLLYFYILLLKYKYPAEVQDIDSIDEKGIQTLFGKRPKFLLANVKDAQPQPFFDAVTSNLKMEDTQFFPIDKDNRPGMGQFIKDYGEEKEEAETLSWSFILYKKDLKALGSIPKKLHVLEYLFNKVESYGRDIPMDKKEEEIVRGTIIKFGKWYMNADDLENGVMRPIEWQVLDVEEDGTLFVISRYGLEARAYNDEDIDATWEECSLRRWLNDESDSDTFYAKAFSKDEKMLIFKTKLKNDGNPQYGTIGGNDTEDKVFLLSIEEAYRYFSGDEERICEATGHALEGIGRYYEQRGWDNLEANYGEDHRCWWWLRSPGRKSSTATYVDNGGSLHFRGSWVSLGDYAVRPSLRIHL